MTETSVSGVGTLVIGVDALSHDVLDRLSPGTTPTIDALIDEGASGPIESQLPPWTPSAWPSIYTGVNPGKHGVFSFLDFDGYDWDVVNATDVRECALWELVSDHGLRSVVVNVPVTDPPGEFDGALIPGYIAPSNPTCRPEGLLEEVREAIGGYRLYNKQLSEGATREERIDGYEELIAMRGAALRYLLDRESPDFGFVQFQQSDTVLHEFPEETEGPDRVYAAIDEEIATTLDAFDPDNVVLVSDHGIGPYEGVEFRPNTFLRDRGLVQTSTSAEKPSWSQLSKEKIRTDGTSQTTANGAHDASSTNDGGSVARSAAERALSVATMVGITSQRIGAVLERLGLAEAVLRVVPDDLVRAGSEHVDFAASHAFMRDRIEMGIRINLEGREPNGIVPKSKYESVRTDLIESLRALRTPDGDPVFDDVLPREDVFTGPYVEDAPDVITVPADFDVFLSASVMAEPFGTPREAWNHKLHGLVAVTGEGIPSTTLRSAHLLDVAPTVLSLLGVPVSDRMDGAALPVVEETPRETYPPYEGGDRATEDANVEDRLANLGYLE